MNKEFTRIRTMADMTISSILLISGIVLVVLPTSVSVNILGFFILVMGILLLALLKTGWQDQETKERYCKKEFFFPGNSKAGIMNALENNIENIDMSDAGKGEGLMMDIYYNRQNGKAFISLFTYVPYRYEPASPTFQYPIDRISKFID